MPGAGEKRISFCDGQTEEEAISSMCDVPPTLEMRRVAALESIAESLKKLVCRLEEPNNTPRGYNEFGEGIAGIVLGKIVPPCSSDLFNPDEELDKSPVSTRGYR
jgi:hypothetical protein